MGKTAEPKPAACVQVAGLATLLIGDMMGAGAYLGPLAAEAVRDALTQLLSSIQHDEVSMSLMAPAMLRVAFHLVDSAQYDDAELASQVLAQVVAALPEHLFRANKAAICAIIRRCPPTTTVLEPLVSVMLDPKLCGSIQKQLAGCILRLPANTRVPEAWLESLATSSDQNDEMAQLVCEWVQYETQEAPKRLPEAKMEAMAGLVQHIDCRGDPTAIERVRVTLEAFNNL